MMNSIDRTYEFPELQRNFARVQKLFSSVLPKVNPDLLIDLLKRQLEDPTNSPFYTLEVFTKESVNTEEVRNRILRKTGTVPSIHDNGTHIVANHRVTLGMLKEISAEDNVVEITGSYSGGGSASLGATHEHNLQL